MSRGVKQSRRRFLKELAAMGGVAAVMGNARAAWAATGAVDPLGLPIGTQTYPIREMFGEDGANFMATMRELSSMRTD